MTDRSLSKSGTPLPHSAKSKRRSFSLDWRQSVLLLVLLVLVYQVVIPFLMIIWTSLKTVRPGEQGFLDLSFSLANYVNAFGDPVFWNATLDTLAFSLASTLLSFALGAFVAWAIERTNTPLARVIGVLLMARIIIPGILITVSWIFLASPNIGILNNLIFRISGIRNLFDIYTFWGMVWIHAIEMVPLTYLLLAAAFRSMDPRLEEASTMTGAGNWRTLRLISLPLALPAIGAALLLLFITTIDTFEVPLLIGARADIRVYTTEIYLNTSRTPVDWGLSSTYSVALLLISIVLLYLYFRLIRHGDRYQTITGKDFRPRRIDLGGWKYLTCALGLLIVLLTTGVPFLMMLYASFLPFYQPPSSAAFASMTLSNYTTLFNDGFVLGPLINSTVLGIVTATIVVLFVTLIAYFVQKTNIRGRKIIDFLAFSAIAIPGVVLGASILWFYLLVPLPIIGTLTIIFLAYFTKYIPFALRFVSSSMQQVHDELEEAGQVCGQPWATNFFRIILPLIKPGLLAAWFWVMVHAFRELTLALMLARSGNRTAAVVIYDLWENGSFLRLSAFGVVIFFILMAIVLASSLISRRYGVKDA